MTQPFDLSKQLGSIDAALRLDFYELLAHNLTVAIRVLIREELPCELRLDAIAAVNELLHQVTASIPAERNGKRWAGRHWQSTSK